MTTMGEKHHQLKKSRSQSPKKSPERSHHSGKEDHNLQKKVLERRWQFKRSHLDLVHLTMMLKNTTNQESRSRSPKKVLKDATNSGKEDHNLQRKVLKDAGTFKRSQSQSSSFNYEAENTTNSRKVGHNLQRKVLKDAANSGKEDHNLQRKVLKDATN